VLNCMQGWDLWLGLVQKTFSGVCGLGCAVMGREIAGGGVGEQMRWSERDQEYTVQSHDLCRRIALLWSLQYLTAQGQ
jgi:hypothetical protein